MIALCCFEGVVICLNLQRTDTQLVVSVDELVMASVHYDLVTHQSIIQSSVGVLSLYWHFILFALTDCSLKYYSGVIFKNRW